MFRLVCSSEREFARRGRGYRRLPCISSRTMALRNKGCLIPPPKVCGNGPRLCAEHQPQRHGEATRFGIIRRLLASALAAAGPSDTAALRWWFQDAPESTNQSEKRFTPEFLQSLSRKRS